MKIHTSTICKIGGRDYNQDSFDIYEGEKSACLVVCDGLGAYVGSEVASKLAAKSITKAFSEMADTKLEVIIKPESVKKNFKLAHGTILARKEKQPSIRSSCTTAVALFTDFKNTTVGHIGDSRFYFFRDDKLEYQSIDHSLAQMAVERGEIKPKDIRLHKDQNKLTRVLGSELYLPPDTKELGALSLGDKVILCSDGFWEYVYEEEMEDVFSKAESPKDALEEFERLLLARADVGHDNYTAIVGFVVEKDYEDTEAKDEDGSKD